LKKNKNVIEAIHERDLKEFLINLDLYTNFKKRLIKCIYCDDPVQSDNICVIHIKNGKLEFVCSNDSCYEKFIMHQMGEENV